MKLWERLFGKSTATKKPSAALTPSSTTKREERPGESADRRYYTSDPAKAFERAMMLQEEHGGIKAILFRTTNEAEIFFYDETRFVLGGFSVGYHGTGPDYTKTLIHQSGFLMPLPKVEEMKVPVVFAAHMPPCFVPDVRRIEAQTVEEAREKALSSAPPGREVVALAVHRDVPGRRVELEVIYGPVEE